MYGIFTYIWAILMVNVGKYSIHGSYGNRTWKKNAQRPKALFEDDEHDASLGSCSFSAVFICQGQAYGTPLLMI